MFLKAELYLFEIFILRVTYRLAGAFLHTLLVKSAGCPITIAIAKLRIGYIYSTREILHNFSTYEAREKLRVRRTHGMFFAVAYMAWTGKWDGNWGERRFPVPFPFRSFRAENNGQQVAGHDGRPNIFLPGQTPILAGQIMNTTNFFFA